MHDWSACLRGYAEMTRTIIRAGRNQRGTVAQYDALEEESISSQMVLSSQVNFVHAFFEGLLKISQDAQNRVVRDPAYP